MKTVKSRQYMDWYLVATLALGLFIGGVAINVLQMGIDYAVTTYTSDKFVKWQDDLIKQYQEEHPGSHPETKDYPGGDDSKSL